MNVNLDKVAEAMGELCGAARGDWVTASPADVGMHGLPVKAWREAYFEGCKDMAEKIAAQVPEEWQARVQELSRAAFTKAFEAATQSADT